MGASATIIGTSRADLRAAGHHSVRASDACVVSPPRLNVNHAEVDRSVGGRLAGRGDSASDDIVAPLSLGTDLGLEWGVRSEAPRGSAREGTPHWTRSIARHPHSADFPGLDAQGAPSERTERAERATGLRATGTPLATARRAERVPALDSSALAQPAARRVAAASCNARRPEWALDRGEGTHGPTARPRSGWRGTASSTSRSAGSLARRSCEGAAQMKVPSAEVVVVLLAWRAKRSGRR